MKILVINGVNMDMLGKRDKNLYGELTLKQLEKYIKNYAKSIGVKTSFMQLSNEGTICYYLHHNNADAVVLNAGAYSHYSIAIRDAIECASVPVVDVHMTNIYEREDFRHVDVLKDVCVESFVGYGKDSYTKAIEYLANRCKK